MEMLINPKDSVFHLCLEILLDHWFRSFVFDFGLWKINTAKSRFGFIARFRRFKA